MDAANNTKTVIGRPFKPGQSGNPKGRPKGVARQVRELLGDDGKGLLEALQTIALDPTEKTGDRIAAARELLDRGFGKAPAYEPVKDGDPLALEGVDADLGTLVDELAARRKARAPRPAANGTLAVADTGAEGQTGTA